ncbi:hypothetical protein VA7868_04307 [Vibrio aerogenes CECT 7868]|uniref:Uncharacterized protein n=1 Tax=Vibrio aerogenes CECT 7868 TaxID=1216006 RepID=A0A1M6DSQ7_9VIBR|nr:hypothetical protein [Vibrio aerogenes]SHI76169.1 hypothetical protein VA7868_04307 [Vibrio aerogenes CECT 7868]
MVEHVCQRPVTQKYPDKVHLFLFVCIFLIHGELKHGELKDVESTDIDPVRVV